MTRNELIKLRNRVDQEKQRRECIEPSNLFVIRLHKFQNLLVNNNYNIERIQENPNIK